MCLGLDPDLENDMSNVCMPHAPETMSTNRGINFTAGPWFNITIYRFDCGHLAVRAQLKWAGYPRSYIGTCTRPNTTGAQWLYPPSVGVGEARLGIQGLRHLCF